MFLLLKKGYIVSHIPSTCIFFKMEEPLNFLFWKSTSASVLMNSCPLKPEKVNEQLIPSSDTQYNTTV